MPSPTARREEITNRAHALPVVGNEEIISHARAEQLLLDLRRTGSRILEHTEVQIERVIDELKPEWPKTEGGDYLLSESDIITLVARSIRRGASQAASDIGSTMNEISSLEATFAGPAEPPTAA